MSPAAAKELSKGGASPGGFRNLRPVVFYKICRPLVGAHRALRYSGGEGHEEAVVEDVSQGAAGSTTPAGAPQGSSTDWAEPQSARSLHCVVALKIVTLLMLQVNSLLRHVTKD